MGLFGKRDTQPKDGGGFAETVPLPGRQAWCRECKADRTFTKCWKRNGYVAQCPCCGVQFDNLAQVYERNQPVCPRCGEFLEHPGFEYGICDGCQSKYELVEGAKPGLLPNKKQRAQMEQYGKSWTRE